MANYDATGLKNAVMYAFNTAAKEAGLDPSDFKLNSIKVNIPSVLPSELLT